MSGIYRVGERVASLFDHLGIATAHFVGSTSLDWKRICHTASERVATFTVVTPYLASGAPTEDDLPNCPFLVIAGDRGKTAAPARALVALSEDVTFVALKDYESLYWSDVALERGDEIVDALSRFIADFGIEVTELRGLAGAEGTHDGITYRIMGSGPVLAITPLMLAPSQWDPVLDRLAEQFTVVVMGGEHLGAVATLEERVAAGYGEFATSIVRATLPRPGERVLEVGCGSGAIARAVVSATDGMNPVTAIDLNRYLVSEARNLAASKGVADQISFEIASGEALPFEDGAFEISICFTVLEEVDADRTISEIARVTRPGGRIALVTRAVDVVWWSNLPVSEELAGKMNSLGLRMSSSGVGPRGCGDKSLYDRVLVAGLTPIQLGPQYCTYSKGQRLEAVIGRLVGALDGTERDEAKQAVSKLEARKALLVAEPFHVAIVRKGS